MAIRHGVPYEDATVGQLRRLVRLLDQYDVRDDAEFEIVKEDRAYEFRIELGR